MAEYLKHAILKRSLRAALLALTALPGIQAVAGGDLVDPTRPPAGFGHASADSVTTGPVLQSILISPTRKIAIISGKTVKVGDSVGDGEVIAIRESEVVLRAGKSKQVLKLYPSLHNPAPTSRSGSNLEIPGQSR